MKATDPVHTIEGRHIGESAKAVKFRVEIVAGEVLGEPRNEWFPFSQMLKSSKAAPNSTELDTLVVSEWILNEKGLL